MEPGLSGASLREACPIGGSPKTGGPGSKNLTRFHDIPYNLNLNLKNDPP
jgi:hypothetical protein